MIDFTTDESYESSWVIIDRSIFQVTVTLALNGIRGIGQIV